MKLAALILRSLIAMLGFLPCSRATAWAFGFLSALLDACKGEMAVTGDAQGIKQVESVGQEIETDVLVSQAKRAQPVFDKEL